MTPIVTTEGGVTLIGGGAVGRGELALALSLAPTLVAADGGADAALAEGQVPVAVIGDLDSISDAARAAIPGDALHRVAEQDSTDFQKCLTRISARFVIAVGFAGRRLDHTLAALTVMARLPGRPPVLMIAAEDVVFVCPPRLTLSLAAGTRVSLWPIGRAQGTSAGLRWPIDGIDFAPDGRVGTSNEAVGTVTLTMDGSMLVLLPRDQTRAALAALLR